MNRLLCLTVMLGGCVLGGDPFPTVTWSPGDGMCMGPAREAQASAGRVTLQAQVIEERPSGRTDDAAGLHARLLRLGADDGSVQVVDEATVDASGAVTFSFDLPEPALDRSIETFDYELGLEGTDSFDEGEYRTRLRLTSVASGLSPWIGCQQWLTSGGAPLTEPLQRGLPVRLGFHVQGDVQGAAPIEITFRERGGDLCGPDPFGTFTTPVDPGPNGVPWNVDVSEMDVCESEKGASEITFSTPLYLSEEGVWEGTLESAEREIGG